MSGRWDGPELTGQIDPHRTLVRPDQEVGYGVQRTSRGSLHSFQVCRPKRLTENELSDFSRLCHDDCGKQ